MLKYKYRVCSKKNTRAEDKPNEDMAALNEDLGVGMVLDGVSRDRENGAYPKPSPAKIASQVFADAVLEEARTCGKAGLDKIKSMIYNGNAEVRKYNQQLKHQFPAGTVGIVFSIENAEFHYGYIGDCYAAIIREGMMRTFTECQTAMVSKHKKEFTADEIRFAICNHISHPCGYGVWDGNSSAMDFVKYGTIRIADGDTILAYTDGMKEIIDKMELRDLAKKSLSEFEDMKPSAGLDDRTCIRITIKNG